MLKSVPAALLALAFARVARNSAPACFYFSKLQEGLDLLLAAGPEGSCPASRVTGSGSSQAELPGRERHAEMHAHTIR
jgi:hypothetical protein